MTTCKDLHITRIMFHNVNSLSARGAEGFDMFANEQHQLQVDIQCFSEHCLDTTKYSVYQEAQDTIRRHFPGQSSLQLSSSTEPAVNIYKPGGTGILVLGELVGRQEPHGKGGDEMGRWSYLHLRRHHLPPLTIISAYQVCARPTNLLGNTAYHQQQRSLAQTTDSPLHPRQAFIRDLGKFVQDLQTKGHDIILGGDFNESLDDRHSGILKLITTHDLLDPFLHKFPHHPPFGTHVLGHRRIDSIYVTARLLNHLTKIGYAPFAYATTSDHRPLLAEFDTQALFGQHLHPLRPASSRLVRTKDKKSVSKFVNTWYKMLAQYNAFEYLSQIENDTAPTSVVELVDELIGTCGDGAEKACKRRRPEFFTCQLVQQRLRVSLLRAHQNSLRMGIDRTAQLKSRMRRAGLDFYLPETRRLTSEALAQAKIDLKETCQRHSEIRQNELAEKIDQASGQRNKNKARILRAIKASEDNQRTYRILQAMKRRTTESQTIDRIEIPATWPLRDQPIDSINQLEDPKEATTWRTVTNPSDIEYYLLLRNRLHFGQAEGTPFTRSPLVEAFDWSAASPSADLTLNGQHTFNSVIPQCNDLLTACQAILPLDTLPAKVTMADFRAKIRVWRETTTTSPSGRHLGRYKALFSPGLSETTDQTDPPKGECSFQSKQETIAGLIVAVLNYCIRNNYVLTRWKKIVNVMIFKELGNFQIHRLRVIHIYEADFNLLLAVKWRQLLRESDKRGVINEGQFGGRPGCEAQSLTLLEELKYDLAYLTRRTLVNFDNDAASCYDRIVVPFASLINRKYGLHRQIAAVHGNTLRQARFYLKTTAGISENYYSHCQVFPIHGTGQGSGNSPCIWLFISSTLFDVHKNLSNGARFVSPDGAEEVTMSMVGFVDDSTGTCNDFSPNREVSLDQLLMRMQTDAQLWNNLLYCSGGKLELKKCSFHVLRFDFKPNGTPVPDLSLYQDQIRLTDIDTADHVSILSKRAFDPHKTLGHHKAPYSKPKRELETIKSKATRMSILIGTSPLTRQGAYLAYHTVYIPSVSYSLPQSFFTQRELDLAQGPSMQKVIAKCGYNRHTSRALLYAPTDYTGGGFLSWYMLQGEGQIRQFLKHWRTDSLISRTLKITLAWAQWQSGHSRPILQDVTSPLSYLECRWLSSLRQFLAHIQAELYVDRTFIAPPERQHDSYIMDHARDSQLFSESDLRIINYCRIYLHVTTISELFQPDGKTLIRELYDCQREPWFNPDTFVTLQRRPSEFQIRSKWQRLIRQFTSSAGELAASLNLGSWTCPGHQLRRRRQTYLHSSGSIIYHWQGDRYGEYRSTTGSNERFIFIKQGPQRPTVEWTPIWVKAQHDGSLQCTSILLPINPTRPSLAAPRNFHQYVTTLSNWEQALLHGVHFHYQPNEIRYHLSNLPSNNSLLVVSDGSQRDELLSYGWVIGTEHGIPLAEHSGIGTGDLTSHRAEAWGMVSAGTFLHHIFLYTQGYEEPTAVQTHVTFMADNNGLITRLQKRLEYEVLYPTATLAPDWDLVEQISTITKQLPLPYEFQWIRGHQDPDSPDISVAALYNIQADYLAGQVPSPRKHRPDQPIFAPAEKCTLMIERRSVHGHYGKAIRRAYNLPPLYKYLETRYGWTPQLRQAVDWDLVRRTAANIQVSHVQLLKLIHNKLPTNHELAKSNPFQSARCHYCREPETFHHLCKCANPISDRFRQDVLLAVTSYMESRDVPSSFQVNFLRCLRISLDIPVSNNSSDATEPCLTEQLLLGGQSILQGFWSRQWSRSYTRSISFYSLDQTSNSEEVLSGLIKILWDAQLQFWTLHLANVAASDSGSSSHLADKTEQFKTKIRLLHASRDKCLHGHRDLYFHSDVEAFLRTATFTQMKTYLHHYESAINLSITAAQGQKTRSLLTFPGFRRIRKAATRSPARRLQLSPQIGNDKHNRQPPPLTEIGDDIQRKHTRWKQPFQFVRTLPSFFSSTPR